MIEELDLEILYFFNVTLSSSFLDTAMTFLTNLRNWIPVYSLAAFFLVWKYKWRGVRVVLASALLVGVVNIITNVFIKEFFERSRPCATDAVGAQIVGWIRLPDGMRHGFSMPSSHAVNNFAIAIFFSIVFSTRKVMGWVFTIALIVALTRLYLGLHYPSDILAGIIFGIALGYYFAKGYIFLEGKYFRGDELLLP